MVLETAEPLPIQLNPNGNVQQRQQSSIQFTKPNKTVTTASTVVFSGDLLGLKTKTLTLKNTGAVDLAGAGNSIQVSPTGEDTDWEDLDATAFDGLSAGEVRSLTFDTVHRFWRINALVGAGATTITPWVDATIF